MVMQARGTAVRPWREIDEADSPVSDAPGTPRRGRVQPRNLPNIDASAWWASSPRALMINGISVVVFPVGALARALGRSSYTVRRWEQMGLLPSTAFADRRGPVERQRRYYTLSMISAAERIAAEELPCGKIADFRRQGRFTRRVTAEWDRILAEHQAAATAQRRSPR
jgi:DNA-binding transcriptional MerR regulator